MLVSIKVLRKKLPSWAWRVRRYAFNAYAYEAICWKQHVLPCRLFTADDEVKGEWRVRYVYADGVKGACALPEFITRWGAHPCLKHK